MKEWNDLKKYLDSLGMILPNLRQLVEAVEGIECRRLRKTAPRRRWTSQEDEIMRESGLTAAVMSGLFDRSVAAVEKHARDLNA